MKVEVTTMGPKQVKVTDMEYGETYVGSTDNRVYMCCSGTGYDVSKYLVNISDGRVWGPESLPKLGLFYQCDVEAVATVSGVVL